MSENSGGLQIGVNSCVVALFNGRWRSLVWLEISRCLPETGNTATLSGVCGCSFAVEKNENIWNRILDI
jgi:hypothetical protein